MECNRRSMVTFQGRTYFTAPCWLACMQVFRVVKVDRVLTWRFWAVRILPVGFFMALTLQFGNVVYLYLTVAFIQMLKVPARRHQGPMSACAKHHARGLDQLQLGVAVRVPLLIRGQTTVNPFHASSMGYLQCCLLY